MSDKEIREHCNSYGYSDGEAYAYRDGYKQGREDVIDDVEKELLANGFIVTQHALEVWREIAGRLKEKN